MAKSVPTHDIDALLAEFGRRLPGTGCTVGSVLAKLDPGVRAKVDAALADKDSYSAPGLAALFTRLGYPISRGPVERHRRGECACARR